MQIDLVVNPRLIAEIHHHASKAAYGLYGTDFNADIVVVYDPIKALNETQFSACKAALQSYFNFESNWDGYGGTPPRYSAVEEALWLINEVQRLDLPAPRCMLANDGEVGIYWRNGRFYLEVGFFWNWNVEFMRDRR